VTPKKDPWFVPRVFFLWGITSMVIYKAVPCGAIFLVLNELLWAADADVRREGRGHGCGVKSLSGVATG
jgi:hypothetical protein